MIPTSLCPTVIGTPEILNFAMSSLASLRLCSGLRKKGSVMTPFSERFTMSTSSACSSIVMFLWIMPIPPQRAMAIAIWCSVTVSIPAERKGIFRRIVSVSLVERSASYGTISEYCGTSKTSSNVMPSPMIFAIFSFSLLNRPPFPKIGSYPLLSFDGLCILISRRSSSVISR